MTPGKLGISTPKIWKSLDFAKTNKDRDKCYVAIVTPGSSYIMLVETNEWSEQFSWNDSLSVFLILYDCCHGNGFFSLKKYQWMPEIKIHNSQLVQSGFLLPLLCSKLTKNATSVTSMAWRPVGTAR